MKEFSVPMALVDYLPVIFFLLGTNLIARDLKHAMSKVTYILFRAGSLLVFVAGALKATYKLLYALKVGELVWMSNQFFANQAFGFLLAGIGITLAVIKPRKDATYAIIPTMGLVGIMVVGLGAMDVSLAFLASKLRKRSALICFIVSFFLCLCMGYLSTKDFDKAFMNWMAQGINVVGQLLLYVGARILHEAGLKDY